MIKKSFGIALLTASVLVMGCSSDDDDPTPAATDTATADAGMTDTATADAGMTDTATADAGMTDTATADAGMTDTAAADAGMTDTAAADAGMTTDAGMTDGGIGETDGGAGGLMYRATSIMGVIASDARLSGLATALNPDFDQTLDTENQGWTVFAPTNDALAASGVTVTGPVLQSHIFTQGAVMAADLVAGQTVSMSNNNVYTITTNAAGGFQIGGVDIIEADLAVDNGALHIIDGVLQ